MQIIDKEKGEESKYFAQQEAAKLANMKVFIYKFIIILLLLLLLSLLLG